MLTRREREALALLAGGHTTEEISEALGVSLFTARNHLARAVAKLGARSRLEAIILAKQQGLLRA